MRVQAMFVAVVLGVLVAGDAIACCGWLGKKAKQVLHVPAKVGEKVGEVIGGDVGRAVTGITAAPEDAMTALENSPISIRVSPESQQRLIHAVLVPPPLTENPDAPEFAASDGSPREDESADPADEDDEAQAPWWRNVLSFLGEEAWDKLVEGIFGGPGAAFIEVSAPTEIGPGDTSPQGYAFPGCVECSTTEEPSSIGIVPIEPDTRIGPPP